LLQSKETALIKSNIRKQKLALTQLEKSVDLTIIKAVNLLYKNKGRIIITGIGKSGYIGLIK
jgi:D-arabinose 5-phosphate isomerase GutQ